MPRSRGFELERDGFSFLDEPDGQRRRRGKKKKHEGSRKAGARSRRPRYDSDTGWDDDLDAAELRLARWNEDEEDDEFDDLDDLDEDTDWDLDDDWQDGDDEEDK